MNKKERDQIINNYCFTENQVKAVKENYEFEKNLKYVLELIKENQK